MHMKQLIIQNHSMSSNCL